MTSTRSVMPPQKGLGKLERGGEGRDGAEEAPGLEEGPAVRLQHRRGQGSPQDRQRGSHHICAPLWRVSFRAPIMTPLGEHVMARSVQPGCISILFTRGATYPATEQANR